MDPTTLLTIGAITVAFVCGSAFDFPRPSMESALPDPVQAIAKELGELHVAHTKAKEKEASLAEANHDVNTRLAVYIEKLKTLFSRN